MNSLYVNLLRSALRSPSRGTLVATRSFNYVDSFGRPQHIEAGETYVDSSTEEARRFPGSFKPANGRTVSKPTHRSLPRPEAKLQVPTEVLMTWKLQRALKEEVARMGDHLEAGGFLYGRIEPHVLGATTRAQVLDFSSGPHLFSQRTAGTLQVSSAHLEEALGDPRIVGDWHTHGTRGSFQPSDIDVGGWGARSDQVSWRSGRAPGYIGLIIAADDGQRWVTSALQLRAWLVPPLRYDVPPAEREPKAIPIREVG